MSFCHWFLAKSFVFLFCNNFYLLFYICYLINNFWFFFSCMLFCIFVVFVRNWLLFWFVDFIFLCLAFVSLLLGVQSIFMLWPITQISDKLNFNIFILSQTPLPSSFLSSYYQKTYGDDPNQSPASGIEFLSTKIRIWIFSFWDNCSGYLNCFVLCF